MWQNLIKDTFFTESSAQSCVEDSVLMLDSVCHCLLTINMPDPAIGYSTFPCCL